MTHEHNQNPLVPSLIGTLFVLGVLIFALLLAIKNTPLVVYVQESGGQTSPLGHSPSAESLTALLYILPTIAATFALAVWIKRDPRRGIKVLIGASFAVATGLIGFFSYWWWLGTQYTAILIIGLVAAFILSFSYKSVFSVPFIHWALSII